MSGAVLAEGLLTESEALQACAQVVIERNEARLRGKWVLAKVVLQVKLQSPGSPPRLESVHVLLTETAPFPSEVP